MFHKCERRNKKRPRGGWKKIGAPVWVKSQVREILFQRRSLFALEGTNIGNHWSPLKHCLEMMMPVLDRLFARSRSHRTVGEKSFGQSRFFFDVCSVANVWLRNICRASRWWEVTTRLSLSLSHTRTHTHTRMYKRKKPSFGIGIFFNKISLSFTLCACACECTWVEEWVNVGHTLLSLSLSVPSLCAREHALR